MIRVRQLSAAAALATVLVAGAGTPALAAGSNSTSTVWATHTTDRHIAPLQLAPGQHLAAGTTTVSGNWSGYQLSVAGTGTTPSPPSTPYTAITGQWIVPTATQETAGQAEDGATWIGIGGGNDNPDQPVGSPTLIQEGIGESISTSGSASYYAWYEIIPEPETQVSMPVSAGDVISASISESSTPEDWVVSLKDLTNGQGFTQNINYPSTMDTAEWIVEAPTEIGTSPGEATLPNLGNVYFQNSTLNGAPAPLASGYAMQMEPGTSVISAPSDPDASGVDFNVCTYSGTTCAAPTATGPGGGDVPEAPVAVAIPVVGLGAAGLLLVRRRRRRPAATTG